MAHLTIYKDNYAESTAVSNCFIDEYMKDANDAQLKVYLYLLRMLDAGAATSVSDMADRFNHTEKDVLRALSYWEARELLTLEYDQEQNLAGIHLRDLMRNGCPGNVSMTTPGARRSPAPPAGPLLSAPAAAAPARLTAGAPLPRLSAEPLPQAPGVPLSQAPGAPLSQPPVRAASPVPEQQSLRKPAFTADQLKEFQNRADTAQLLFIAESYLGKPLTANEMRSILYFTDVLHFSEDLVDYLIQYCVDRGKKDFKYIEKVAVNWADEGITTPGQAMETASKYDRNVYAIMNMLGKSGAPTPKEAEYISRWTKEYGFANDIILEACERTVMATDKHRFEYAEGILRSWKQEDVHHKSDICRIDDLHRQRRKTAPKTAPSGGNNRFNHFTQNDYDFDELERELLSN